MCSYVLFNMYVNEDVTTVVRQAISNTINNRITYSLTYHSCHIFSEHDRSFEDKRPASKKVK